MFLRKAHCNSVHVVVLGGKRCFLKNFNIRTTTEGVHIFPMSVIFTTDPVLGLFHDLTIPIK